MPRRPSNVDCYIKGLTIRFADLNLLTSDLCWPISPAHVGYNVADPTDVEMFYMFIFCNFWTMHQPMYHWSFIHSLINYENLDLNVK